jgi:hypothetical protein
MAVALPIPLPAPVIMIFFFKFINLVYINIKKPAESGFIKM